MASEYPSGLPAEESVPVEHADTSRSGGGEGGRGGGRRSGGTRNNAVAGLVQYDGRMVWVSADSTPTDVAKQITGAALPGARNGFPVYLFSKFEKNTNTAAKGIVNAAKRLLSQQGMHLATIPYFRANRTELTLKVVVAAPCPTPAEDSPLLSVAGKTDAKVLAGAIAKHVRDGLTVTLRGIGAKAVFELFRAITICRAYLDADAQGVDVLAYPEFVEVQLEARSDKTSALSVVVVPTSALPVEAATQEGGAEDA